MIVMDPLDALTLDSISRCCDTSSSTSKLHEDSRRAAPFRHIRTPKLTVLSPRFFQFCLVCIITCHLISGSQGIVEAAVPADHVPREPDSNERAPRGGATGKPPLVKHTYRYL